VWRLPGKSLVRRRSFDLPSLFGYFPARPAGGFGNEKSNKETGVETQNEVTEREKKALFVPG
jgi:hypothetical protein